MTFKKLFVPLFLLIPATASAADNAARCLELGKEIAATPQIIGSTDIANSHNQALANVTATMRQIRSEMQRLRCGGGSIVTFGEDDPCNQLEQQMIDADHDRQAILASKKAQGKVMRSQGRDEAALREEMRRLRCGEIDYATVPGSIDPDQPAAPASSINQQSAIPNSQSSFVQIGKPRGTIAVDTTPKPPEREWNPDRPVRMVGPQFFPDEKDGDLTRPGVQALPRP